MMWWTIPDFQFDPLVESEVCNKDNLWEEIKSRSMTLGRKRF